MRDSSCFFCNIADELMIAEDELCLAMRDGFPVSEGHTLIIPKRHVANYFGLTDEEIIAMLNTLAEVSVVLFLRRGIIESSFLHHVLHPVAEEVFVVEVGETEAGVEGFDLRFVDVDDEADCCVAQ